MKYDGHIGGTNFLTTKGTHANIKISHKNGRFTVIGLTVVSGDAVMCIILFAAGSSCLCKKWVTTFVLRMI